MLLITPTDMTWSKSMNTAMEQGEYENQPKQIPPIQQHNLVP